MARNVPLVALALARMAAATLIQMTEITDLEEATAIYCELIRDEVANLSGWPASGEAQP